MFYLFIYKRCTPFHFRICAINCLTKFVNLISKCNLGFKYVVMDVLPFCHQNVAMALLISLIHFFLNDIVVARFSWPKAQLTINIRRGWVKELSLSESIRSDTWIALLQKNQKYKNELLTYISISLVPHTVFFRPLL